MKAALILTAACLASCAGFTGNEQKGTYAAVFVGTDFKGYAQSSGKVEVGEANQSQTAMSAIRTAGTLGTASLLAGVQTNAADNSTKEVLGGQKVQATGIKSRAATDQLRITEETKRKAIEAIVP